MNKLLLVCVFLQATFLICFDSDFTQNEYVILKAQTHHNLAAITSVINKAFERSLIRGKNPRITIDELRDILRDEHKSLYLCFNNNTLCGTILLDIREQAEMSLFAVDLAHKGKKLGDMLIRYVEDQVKLSKKKYLYLKMSPVLQEKLVDYYRQHGFEQVGDPIPCSIRYLQRHIKPEYWATNYCIVMRKEILI